MDSPASKEPASMWQLNWRVTDEGLSANPGLNLNAFIYRCASPEVYRGIGVIDDLRHGSGKIGKYRALIIGINEYQDTKIPDLTTAVNDGRVLAELLQKRYGFSVKTLMDRKATRKGIYTALRQLSVDIFLFHCIDEQGN